jgi:hypothetical protein
MPSRKSVRIGIVIFGLVAVAASSLAYLRLNKSPPLGETPRIDYPGELPRSEKHEFLKGSFSIIKEVGNLPPPVLRAFIEQGGSRPVMADAGKRFQATDFVLDPSLPSKRLIFAGVSHERCFVHYEQGGRGLHYVLALFTLTSKDSMKPIWRGNCPRSAVRLEDLRFG